MYAKLYSSDADGKDLPVCMAPPMILGARSMAAILWQLYECHSSQLSHDVTSEVALLC